MTTLNKFTKSGVNEYDCFARPSISIDQLLFGFEWAAQQQCLN